MCCENNTRKESQIEMMEMPLECIREINSEDGDDDDEEERRNKLMLFLQSVVRQLEEE